MTSSIIFLISFRDEVENEISSLISNISIDHQLFNFFCVKLQLFVSRKIVDMRFIFLIPVKRKKVFFFIMIKFLQKTQIPIEI